MEELEEGLALAESLSYWARGEFIFDRTPHIGNPIYSRNGGRDGFIPEEELHDRLVTRVNPLVVYCRLDSPDKMLGRISRKQTKSWKSPEQFEIVKEHFHNIVKDYDRVMDLLKSRLVVIPYDYERDSYEILLHRLNTYLTVGDF